MPTAQNTIPLILYLKTRDVVNFTALIRHAARLNFLKNVHDYTPIVAPALPTLQDLAQMEMIASNRDRELDVANSQLYASLLALLNPMNIAMINVSNLVATFGTDTTTPAYVRFISEAYVYPEDTNPAETVLAKYDIHLELERS